MRNRRTAMARRRWQCLRLKLMMPIARRRWQTAGAAVFVFVCTVGNAHRASGHVLSTIRRAVNARGLRAGQATGYLASTERVDQYQLLACAANSRGMMQCIGDRALLPAALVAGGALNVGAMHAHAQARMYRRINTQALTHMYMQCYAPMIHVRGAPCNVFLHCTGLKPAKTFRWKIFVPVRARAPATH